MNNSRVTHTFSYVKAAMQSIDDQPQANTDSVMGSLMANIETMCERILENVMSQQSEMMATIRKPLDEIRHYHLEC